MENIATENIDELDLSLSEAQASDELNAEELEAVAGGGLFGAALGGLVGGVVGYIATGNKDGAKAGAAAGIAVGGFTNPF
ncbi:MAG TPA: hypothetical protein DCP31_24865 [Cyanobacteria bacterium UBA8543]|nr:hypothetical protein [Cyanobacteria bacterium UBA8543]